MDMEERAIVCKFSNVSEECKYVENELLNYIDMLKEKGVCFDYTCSSFEDFLLWYSKQKPLISVVGAFKCQEIINLVFDYSIDRSNEYRLF